MVSLVCEGAGNSGRGKAVNLRLRGGATRGFGYLSYRQLNSSDRGAQLSASLEPWLKNGILGPSFEVDDAIAGLWLSIEEGRPSFTGLGQVLFVLSHYIFQATPACAPKTVICIDWTINDDAAVWSR